MIINIYQIVKLFVSNIQCVCIISKYADKLLTLTLGESRVTTYTPFTNLHFVWAWLAAAAYALRCKPKDYIISLNNF